jgi:hypothetical protein
MSENQALRRRSPDDELPAMNRPMVRRAQRDEILEPVLPALGPRPQVMDIGVNRVLATRHLTTPAVASHHPTP